ncbi:MAG: VCBS repeat-containing protein [candidate division NC10 bacterium]|nr:VCBS repeat-containing protein [candidate division NC10 bacterium]
MVHPVTRQVLGAYEKNLGVLRVTEVREKYSRGTLDAAGAEAGIVAGDRVRLSSRRLRTLLHVSGAAAGIEIGPLAQALLERGEESGRFSMIDEPAWAQFLMALGEPWEIVRAKPAALRDLGERAAADLLLAARIEPGGIPRVTVEVRSLRTGAVLGELSERWPVTTAAAQAPMPSAAPPAAPTATLEKPGATTPAQAGAVSSSKPGEYTVRELASPAKSLAAGNILGEGRLELVISDGSRLSLYRWEEGSLAWRWDEDGRAGRRILSLDAADLDGDGRTEVIVTMVRNGRVTSELRRWRDGSLSVDGAIDGVYLRTASRRSGPALLLGQRAGLDEVLSGRVEQYRLREGALERVADSALPRGVGIFGLALAPVDGPVMLYALDRAGFLAGLAPEGAIVWRSTRPYGGYPPPLTARELFGPGPMDEQGFDDEARAFQGRLLAGEAPGGVRLVVPRNFSDSPVTLVHTRSLGQGQVVILEGLPESPDEVLRSRPFDGYVADLARADIDGDGSPEIIFAVNRFAGPLLGERGRLVAWRLTTPPDRHEISP